MTSNQETVKKEEPKIVLTSGSVDYLTERVINVINRDYGIRKIIGDTVTEGTIAIVPDFKRSGPNLVLFMPENPQTYTVATKVYYRMRY